jgi:hypothetical protein
MPFPNDLPVDFVPKIGEWSSSGNCHDSTKRLKTKRYHSLSSCSTKGQEESDILNLRMIFSKPTTCWSTLYTQYNLIYLNSLWSIKAHINVRLMYACLHWILSHILCSTESVLLVGYKKVPARLIVGNLILN